MEYEYITFEAYQQFFEAIISKTHIQAPYNEEAYYDYVKMNLSRQNRWLKTVEISESLKSKILNTQAKEWIVITEPWCGDAAHLVPLFYLMSKENPEIKFKIVLRDANENFMNQYLTNGTKSIPVLVMRNEKGEDTAVWGPRPKSLQVLMAEWKKEGVTFEALKIALQKWYNADKGKHTFEEFLQLNF